MKTNWVSLPVTLTDVLDDKKFIIPVFQRSIVWKPKKRKDFIKAVRSGEPFGVILVHANNNGKYELIDGLQRISTLRDYVNSKFDYVTEDDLNTNLCEEIMRIKLRHEGLAQEPNYISKRGKEIRSLIFENLKAGVPGFRIMNAVADDINLPNNDDVSETVDKICKEFEESTDISGLSILAINYTGPAENIPDVFYNLNTGAVSLTKYETYAALWSTPVFKIADKKLLDAVEEKYIQLQNDSDLEVDYSQEDIHESGISLFEFCYGLGRLIRDKERGFDILMGSTNKNTDPIGFEMLALVLGEKVNHADKIYDLLKDKSPDFLLKIMKVIIDSVEQVSTILRQYIKAMNGSSLTSDSTYLTYHVLISYIREYYEINLALNSVIKRENGLPICDFRKYMPIHYLYDCISDYWGAHRQVSDLDRDIDDSEKRHKYWYAIKLADWTNAIDDFLGMQNSIKTNIPLKNRLFLEYYMQLKLKEKPQYTKYFKSDKVDDDKNYVDIEHIVPKKVIEKKIKTLPIASRKAFSISAIGNLCYLSVKDNRSKRDKTIYDFKEDRPSFAYNSEYLSFIDYPSADALGFLNLKTDEFCDEYDSFIESRQFDIKEEFLKLVKKYWL